MDRSALRKLIKKAALREKYRLIIEKCSNLRVLDVGCVGQDANSQTDKWLHADISKVASALTGVDISMENIEKLKKQGYVMLHTDELTDQHGLYDVIVMADVIEHVSNPENFLRFYTKFLSPGGIMIISTPNANRAINFFSILAFNNYSVNDEHTCWFCPMTLFEVIQRSELKLKEFYWLKRYYTLKNGSLTTRVLTIISDVFSSLRKNFNQNFVFIVTK